MAKESRRVGVDRRPPVFASIKNRIRRGFPPVVVKEPLKYLNRGERERRRTR